MKGRGALLCLAALKADAWRGFREQGGRAGIKKAATDESGRLNECCGAAIAREVAMGAVILAHADVGAAFAAKFYILFEAAGG